MSDDPQRQVLEIVGDLAIRRQIDEQLILAMLRSHPSKPVLAEEVRRFADDLLADMTQQHQATASLWINAILEALGESPGRPPG